MPLIHKYDIDDSLYDISSPEHLSIRELTSSQVRNKTIQRNKSMKKPVNQYDLDGRYIQTYESIDYVKKHVDGCSSIGAVLSDKISTAKTAGGFQWAYDTGDHTNIEPVTPNRKLRPVLQINPEDLSIIAEYSSLAEAKRILGKPRAHIEQVCKGHRKSCLNCYWAYKDDETWKERLKSNSINLVVNNTNLD